MTEKKPKQDSGKAAPWFRIFAGDFLAATGALTPSEAGIYIKLLAVMHLHAEPIPDDIGRLARRVGADIRTFKPARDALLEAGLIVSEDGFLWSAVSETELENITRKSKIASENVATRYRKNKQNQRSISTDVPMSDVRYQMLDDQAPSEPDSSSTSPSSNSHTGESGDEAARDGAAPRSVRVNDELKITGIGDCWVTKIISIKPYHFTVESRDDDGFPLAFLVDRQFRWQAISLNEAEAMRDVSGEPRDRTA